jgi:integrase/recombinase XerD
MIDLDAAVDSYLAMRRGLGFTLVDAGSLLPDFVAFLHRNGAEHVSTELALAWATRPANVSPVWWRQRLTFVRGFAEYLRTIDPVAKPTSARGHLRGDYRADLGHRPAAGRDPRSEP